ncbi:MAG: hypothetical protein M5U12_35240 [Verrucomicrobia bacterium]|nr:hypothetical protein [Verrucomicrobiota bacterium]
MSSSASIVDNPDALNRHRSSDAKSSNASNQPASRPINRPANRAASATDAKNRSWFRIVIRNSGWYRQNRSPIGYWNGSSFIQPASTSG